MGLTASTVAAFLMAISALPAFADTGATTAGACKSPAAPLPEVQRKFHPGHYVAVGRGVARKGLKDFVTKGLVGVQLRYRWAELEPNEGQYDFSQVERDLAEARQAGLQLVVMIE